MQQEIDYSKPIIIEYFNYGMSKQAKLIIPPGKLCILVGENNNGKSCLFYGLEWLLFNDPLAKTLINNKLLEQDKKTTLRVRISQDNYFIEIARNLNAISYNINGKIYDKKLNKQNIFDLEENVYVPGFIYVKNCIYSLFNMQGEDRGLFPISENNDQGIYTLFENLLGLINSKKILTAADKEAKELRTKYEINESNLIQKEQKLNALNSILDDALNIDLNTLIEQIEENENTVKNLSQYKNTIKSLLSIQNIDIPTQIDSKYLEECIMQFSKYLNAKLSLEKAILQVQKINQLQIAKINIDKLELCQKIMSKLNTVKTQYIQLTKEQWRLSIEKQSLQDALTAYQAKWKAIEVCPMCGKLMH